MIIDNKKLAAPKKLINDDVLTYDKTNYSIFY